MSVLLIGGYSDNPTDAPALKEMTDYMSSIGVAVDAIHLDTIVYDIAPGSFSAASSMAPRRLEEYDTIYIRGPRMRLLSEAAYYVSRFCVINGINCINDYSLYYPGTKFAQTILFMEHGLPFLRTLYASSASILAHQARTALGFPFIFKTSVGSHGDSNYLIRSQAELEQALADEPDTKFIAQEFCANDRDYRILTAEDRRLIFARHGQADTHVNNTSKGATASLAEANEVPGDIVEMSYRIAKVLNLKIAGVDVVPNLETGKFYFLEVNSQPQLRTGAFLDEKKALILPLFNPSN